MGFFLGRYFSKCIGYRFVYWARIIVERATNCLKYSFHQTKYAKQNPDKLGNRLLEEVLKDYNGQTYWLSANLHSFFKDSKIPKWLNVAVGYGGEGMLSGMKYIDNQLLIVNRYRQFYLSLDVDLATIKTNSAFKSYF